MSNNRLQMLLRFKIVASGDSNQSIDDIIQELSTNLCAPEFLYDAITELRHDDQLVIVAREKSKVAVLTEKGKRVFDFDRQVLSRIVDIDLEAAANAQSQNGHPTADSSE